jgi:hypothetical protein
MVSITRYWKNVPRLGLAALLAVWSAMAGAGSIEPLQASLTPGDDGYTLSAEFAVDLGSRLEEAVSRGVALSFNLEFTLSRKRWYWIDEHVAGHLLQYRLSYNALTRQYRLSVGNLHQSFASLEEALHVLGRLAALPVVAASAVKPGETYTAALRLSLDKSQLPKPFQVDAIANPDWQVEAKVLYWKFGPTGDAK